MRVIVKNKGIWFTVYFYTIRISSWFAVIPKYQTYVYCKNKEGSFETFKLEELEKET